VLPRSGRTFVSTTPTSRRVLSLAILVCIAVSGAILLWGGSPRHTKDRLTVLPTEARSPLLAMPDKTVGSPPPVAGVAASSRLLIRARDSQDDTPIRAAYILSWQPAATTASDRVAVLGRADTEGRVEIEGSLPEDAVLAADGYQPLRVGGLASSVGIFDLRLIRLPIVLGRVVDSQNRAVKDAHVAFKPVGHGFVDPGQSAQGSSQYWAPGLWAVGARATTDENGAFKISRPENDCRLAIESVAGIWNPASEEEARGEQAPPGSIYRLQPLLAVLLRGVDESTGDEIHLQVPEIETRPRLVRVQRIYWSHVVRNPEGRAELVGLMPGEDHGSLSLRVRGNPIDYSPFDVSFELHPPFLRSPPTVLDVPMRSRPSSEYGVLEVAVADSSPADAEYADVLVFNPEWGGKGGESRVLSYRPDKPKTQTLRLPSGRWRLEPPNVATFSFTTDAKGRKEVAYRQFQGRDVVVGEGSVSRVELDLPRSACLRILMRHSMPVPPPQRIQIQFVDLPVRRLPMMLQYLEPVEVVSVFSPIPIEGRVTIASPGRIPVSIDVRVAVGEVLEREVELRPSEQQ
jgi:hypothetical protein